MRAPSIAAMIVWVASMLMPPGASAEHPATQPASHFGHVIDAADHLVSGATVWLICDDGVDLRVAGSTLTDANGRFALKRATEHERVLIGKDGFGLTGANGVDDGSPDGPLEMQLLPA